MQATVTGSSASSKQALKGNKSKQKQKIKQKPRKMRDETKKDRSDVRPASTSEGRTKNATKTVFFFPRACNNNVNSDLNYDFLNYLKSRQGQTQKRVRPEQDISQQERKQRRRKVGRNTHPSVLDGMPFVVRQRLLQVKQHPKRGRRR